MADIDVVPLSDGTYRVTVTERGAITDHVVTVTPTDAERLGGTSTPEHLIAASFRFLLEREPQEAIMGRFDLTVIGRYFPDYEASIASYL